jgi:hypothetical protein
MDLKRRRIDAVRFAKVPDDMLVVLPFDQQHASLPHHRTSI